MEALNLNPEKKGDELIQLVLSLVNTIKDLMEKQALRKIETGQLTEDQIEGIGSTLLALDDKMEFLRTHFNFTEADLEIDLSRMLQTEGIN